MKQEEDVKKEDPVVEKKGLILPTVPQKPKAINIESLILYGLPKSGKTTALSELPNCLIIDVEKGSAFIEGMIVQPPENAGPVSKFKWLKELAAEIKAQGKPYDYVAIDTLSQLDSDSEWVGTWAYMHSIQGKKFNRNTNGEIMKPSDSDYESVLTLANGYGYRYTREAIMDIFESLKGLGKICTIFVCHVADKMISKGGTSEEVMVKDLALVGKTRDILPRLVDATANVWNEEGQFMISFKGDNQRVGGVRAKHLLGYTGPLDWNKVFIKEDKQK